MSKRALAWRSSAEIFGRALRAAATWVWAQRLDAETFGIFTHAWTVNLVLAHTFGFALHQLLLREASADPARAHGYYRSAVRLRLLLLVPEIAVFAFLAMKMSYEPLAAYALLFAAVTVSAFTEIAGHLLMAREAWRDEAQSTLASAVLVAGVSVLFMLTGGGVVLASASVLIGNLIGLAIMVRHAHKNDDGSVAPLHLRFILPWAAFVLIEQASYHFEILWLDETQSHEAVAHFSAVYRILGLSGPLVLVAKQLLLPSAARLTTPQEVARFARAGALVGAGVGIVASAACVLLFPYVLPVLYPFANAETLAVGNRLAWIMVFWFVQTGLVQAALGQGKLRALLIWASAQLALQIGLNAWMGPSGGPAGAASAKVMAAALTLVLLAGPLRIAAANAEPK